MRVLEIPFSPEMTAAVLGGRKTKTSRNKQYGEVGDMFLVTSEYCMEPKNQGLYRITNIEEMCLGEVSMKYFREEGFHHPRAFIQAWDLYHPKRKFRPGQKVFVHTFEDVNP